MDDVCIAFSDQLPRGAAAREHGDRCHMRHREGDLRSRLHLTATVGVLLLSACTGDPAVEPSLTPTPSAAAAPTGVVASPSPSEMVTTSVEADIEAAYQRYLDSTVDAMESGDPAMIEGARGQALTAAQARVAAITSQERIAKGALRPAIQSLDIEDDAAELRDCYAADLTEHDRGTDEQLADRGGTRFAATVQLELDDDGWAVVEFHQGEFCVPEEFADEIEDRYLAFWNAVSTAGSPPDPDHPDLADTAADEQLDGLREQLTGFRDAGQEIRDETVSHPEAVQMSDGDSVAVVRDCRELDPEGGIYDTETGELVHGGAEPGQRDLWETRLELIDDTWKVVDADLIEEDSGCEPADS